MAESKETRRPLNGATVAKYRTKLFANGIWKKLLVKFVLITYLKVERCRKMSPHDMATVGVKKIYWLTLFNTVTNLKPLSAFFTRKLGETNLTLMLTSSGFPRTPSFPSLSASSCSCCKFV